MAKEKINQYGSEQDRHAVIADIAALMTAHLTDEMDANGTILYNRLETGLAVAKTPEQIKADDTPFFAMLDDWYKNYRTFLSLTDDPDNLLDSYTHFDESTYFQAEIYRDTKETISKAQAHVSASASVERLSARERRHMLNGATRKAVDYIVEERRAGNYEGDSSDFRALVVLAYVAARNFPNHEYTGGRIDAPVTGKRELGRDLLFRKAINHLHNFAEYRLSPQEEANLAEYQQLVDEGRISELSPAKRLALQTRIVPILARTELQVASRQAIDFFAASTTNRQSISKELQLVIEQEAMLKSVEDLHEHITEVPALETGWEILPSGPLLDEAIKRIIKGEKLPTAISDRLAHVDLERVLHLLKIVKMWGSGYVAVADLKSKGDCEYYVAILPQVIDGLNVEHAVADNPLEKNAIFVWRAEIGITNGRITKSWRHVFDKSKAQAKSMGARKIVHNGYHVLNVQEYLTRPEERLGSLRYRR